MNGLGTIASLIVTGRCSRPVRIGPTQCCRTREKSIVEIGMEEGTFSVEKLEKSLLWGAVALVFLCFQLHSFTLVLVVWSFGAGLLFAHVLFRVVPRAPNFLLHMSIPQRKFENTASKASASLCPVCGQAECNRHMKTTPQRGFVQPWEGLMLPETVDTALSEFFEIVLHRFVFSWHRNLAPSEAFANELRLSVRFATATILRRLQQVDIPTLVTGKMMQAASAHVHIYLRARCKLHVNATLEDIETAVLKDYGCGTHVAMRGATGDLRYFRHLAASILPYVLPSQNILCSVTRNFILELFSAKVFVPAMNFASKPDYVNRILLLVFDPHSRLQRFFGPASRDVPLLAHFSRRRTTLYNPLHLSLDSTLHSQAYLYSMMQFMKSQGAIHALQLLLTLGELNDNLQNLTHPQDLLSQVTSMCSNYLSAEAPNHFFLDQRLVCELQEVLSGEGSADDICRRLLECNLLHMAHSQVYRVLEDTYLPQFHQSYEFFELYIARTATLGGKSPKKWRRSKQLPSVPATQSLEIEDKEADTVNPASPDNTSPTHPMPFSALYQVQIVDWESCTEGIRPFSVYVILTRREGEADSKSSIETVKRRFREFAMLDSKLKQFYGDIGAQLPSRRPLRNMDPTFVETRRKELEVYLQTLISTPRVQDSQLLISFLTDSSDPSLFTPDSRAGKIIKSVPVPGKVKKERSQVIEDYLQSLLLTIEAPSPQASPQTETEVTNTSAANRKKVNHYKQEVADDISCSEMKRTKPWLQPATTEDPLDLDSVMDLVLYLALHVYHISQWQLTGLLLLKLLGQNSIEAFTHNFIAEKVSLMLQEEKVVQIIHLLRDNLFFKEDHTRTVAEQEQRRNAALQQLLRYPPELFVGLMGGERFRDGTTLLFEMLQCQQLNKQLFFNLLDIIVVELFPELSKK